MGKQKGRLVFQVDLVSGEEVHILLIIALVIMGFAKMLEDDIQNNFNMKLLRKHVNFLLNSIRS